MEPPSDFQLEIGDLQEYIRGMSLSDAIPMTKSGVINGYFRPSYCHECGKKFPWVEPGGMR